MKSIGNLLWFLFTGLWSAIYFSIVGVLWCITIIGIPFGKQCFKFASLSLAPFGNKVKTKFSAHPIANAIWIVLFGWEMAIAFMVMGILWCITFVGIPFGTQCFKFARLSLIPFGAKV